MNKDDQESIGTNECMSTVCTQYTIPFIMNNINLWKCTEIINLYFFFQRDREIH